MEGADREKADRMARIDAMNIELDMRVQDRTRELAAALDAREILLRDVRHRTKNNLQVVASLLHMQARKLAAGPGREAIEECRTRVEAMALIHDMLDRSNDDARVPFSAFTRGLATRVFHANGVAAPAVSLDLAIEEVALAGDQAVPCGLVLNELMTNALKHGFPDGRTGTIRVELARLDGGRLRLAVRDDGVGLPDGMDIQTADSLGLQLVRALAEQLGGELDACSRGGASFQLTFPVEG